MEAEHQAAGDELYEIRRLSSSYTPPADACTTFKVTYQELQDFERDLHQHVHVAYIPENLDRHSVVEAPPNAVDPPVLYPHPIATAAPFLRAMLSSSVLTEGCSIEVCFKPDLMGVRCRWLAPILVLAKIWGFDSQVCKRIIQTVQILLRMDDLIGQNHPIIGITIAHAELSPKQL